MARAAELGRSVRRSVSPNPGVGCVVVTRDGAQFEGATCPPGGNHAEIVALGIAREAEADLTGATAWVTLEPCAHQGRTGPCADALIAAGVQRVVVAIEDPDPQVSGEGLRRLRQAGVEVEVGVAEKDVAEDLAAYLVHRRLGRPFVTLKLAVTIEGRAVSEDPSTQWITGAEARADGHRLRAEHDAILVGANTVRVDNPRLTTRGVDGPDPTRVVLGRAPADAAVHPCLERSGPLEDVLRGLAHDGITSLLAEGGPTVANEFHAADLVDRYVFYVARAEPGTAAAAMAALWNAEAVDATQIGNDVRVTLTPIAKA